MQLIAFLGAHLLFAINGTPDCRALDRSVIHRYSSQAMSARDERRGGAYVTRLLHYWKRLCLQSRADADPDTVHELAMLLRRPSYRFFVSRMLNDVRDNLHLSSSELERALSDQIAIEDGYVERARPFMVTNERTVSSSIRCVLRKSRGQIADDGDCLSITLSDRADEEERERSH